jgi:hypothetical protein
MRTTPLTRTTVPSSVSVPSTGRDSNSRRARRRSSTLRAAPMAADPAIRSPIEKFAMSLTALRS